MNKQLMILDMGQALAGIAMLVAGLCVLSGLVYWTLYHSGKELEVCGEGVVLLIVGLFFLAFCGLRGGFALIERD